MIGRETVYRQRAKVVNDHGRRLDWSDPDELPIESCSVQPAAGSVDRVHRLAVSGTHAVVMPGAPDVLGVDRIRRGGPVPAEGDPVYVIEGEPEVLNNRPRLARTIVGLKRWTG